MTIFLISRSFKIIDVGLPI